MKIGSQVWGLLPRENAGEAFTNEFIREIVAIKAIVLAYDDVSVSLRMGDIVVALQTNGDTLAHVSACVGNVYVLPRELVNPFRRSSQENDPYLSRQLEYYNEDLADYHRVIQDWKDAV